MSITVTAEDLQVFKGGQASWRNNLCNPTLCTATIEEVELSDDGQVIRMKLSDHRWIQGRSDSENPVTESALFLESFSSAEKRGDNQLVLFYIMAGCTVTLDKRVRRIGVHEANRRMEMAFPRWYARSEEPSKGPRT